MRTIYAIQLQTPSVAGTIENAFADLVNRTERWIERKYERSWDKPIQLTLSEQVSLTPLESHSIRSERKLVEDCELLHVDWTHPADNDPSTAWNSLITVARCDSEVELSVLIRLASKRLEVRPVRFDLGRPGLVTDVLNSHNASLDGWKVPSTVERLESRQVSAFVESVLLNNERSIPVVMVSPSVWSGQFTVDSDKLFDRIRGYAHVAVLTDKWAAFKLTDTVDKPLSCYDGAVRVYWPAFKLSDHPFKHRLYLPDSIRTHQHDGLNLDDHLFRTLAAVASFRLTEGKVAKTVKERLAQAELRDVERLRSDVKAGEVAKEDLEYRLLEALDQIERIDRERRRLEDDLSAQQAAWAQVTSSMTADGDPEAEPSVASLDFETVGQAIRKAAEDFGEPLLFLDSALESADESPFKQPKRVYEFFEALYLIASEWREKKGKLGSSWSDQLEKLGFDAAEHISQTSKGKWSDDYSFMYKGQKRLFERHVTLGGKQADKCLSIHWFRDDDELVIAIGHCGRHLTNTSS